MKRRVVMGAEALALLLAACGIAAPFFHANRYRASVEASLSTALGRKVTVTDVRLDLFTGPGFRVSNVTIADNTPGEPFAYVGELRAIPRIWSLWTGRLEFSSLTLEDAHVNLTKPAGSAAVWNFEPLLNPGLLATFPTVQLRGARINFKMGNKKSTFYLLDTDLDIAPQARDGSDWELRFAGEPARTDRPARGFGAIEARGHWKQPPGGSGHLELDIKLAPSEIGDMVALVYGRDAGVHGQISGHAHVAGPAGAVGVEGEMRVAELHGWEQSPPTGGVFVFRVSGVANTQSQHLELFAEPRATPAAVKAHIAADGYLQAPVFEFDLHADALPVASLPALFRNFGVLIPEGLRLEGAMRGGLHYNATDGWQGDAMVRDATLGLKNLPALVFAQAAVELANGTVRFKPVSMVSGADTIGTVAGSYSLGDGSFEVDLSSAGGPFAGLLKTFPIASVPLLSTLQSANWKGDLKFIQTAGGRGRWNGSGELSVAVANVPALAHPLQIARARVQIDGDAIQMQGMDLRAGDIDAEGDYRYVPGAGRPHQFRLSVETADLARLEELFQPVLRRRVNLIELALTLGRAPVPDWLRTMHAEGTVQGAALRIGDAEVARWRSRVQWDGMQVAFPDWQSQLAKTAISGRMNVDLRENTPRYTATAKWRGLPWGVGQVDGSLLVRTAGTGLQTLTNLRVEGTFDGRDLEAEPLGAIETVSGAGEMSWTGDAPQFRIPRIQLVSAGETWIGSGSSQPNGDVVLQLSSKGRQISLAGSLTDTTRNWVER